MALITILTITQAIAIWTGVFMTIGVVLLSIYIADKLRQVLVQIGLDAIQLYSGWQMARLDVQSRQQLLAAASDEARLKLRQQRLTLLGDLSDS